MKIWKHFSIVCILAFFAFSLVFMSCPDADDIDKNDEESESVSGETPTPTVADFNIDNLSQMSGNVTAVTITPKPGKSNGNITIYYNGSTTLPTNVGEYTVTFNVSATSGWKAANGLSAGTLNIIPLSVIPLNVNDLSSYLDSKSGNTKDNPYVIKLKIDNVDDFGTLKTILNNASDKYVYLDLSGSTITAIPPDAFSSWSSDINAHQGLATLIGVTIPDGVKSIGESAFHTCPNLTSVIIPNSVTSIGNWPFLNCTSLTSIIIPNSVTSIGNDAFKGCTNLISVTFEGTIPSRGFSNPFSFVGDLHTKFYAQNSTSGTPGTYTTTAPVDYYSSSWTRINGEDPTPTAEDFNIGNLSQTKDNITAVTITPKPGKSTGTITIYYNGSTTLPTNVGTYVVAFNVSAASGWKAANGLSAGTLTISEGDPTPTREDFNIGNLSQTYGTLITAVTITPKPGKSNGTITIYYNGSTTLPTNIGTYTVTFDVAMVSGWKVANGLSAGTLTISEGDPTPTASDFNIDNLSQTKDNITAVTITPKPGKSTGTITIYYNGSTTLPTNVGTYVVAFNVSATSGWKAANGLSAGTLTISEEDPTPTREDFNIDHDDQIYGSHITAVTITPKPGKSNGNITIYYAGIGGTTYEKSTTLPTNVGYYAVTFDVVAASGWKAAYGLYAGYFYISYPTPTAEDFNIGNLSPETYGSLTAVTITPKPGKSNGAITIYYAGTDNTSYVKSTKLPTNFGTYTVTFDVATVSGWEAAYGLYAGILIIERQPLSINELIKYLSGNPNNTKDNPYVIEMYGISGYDVLTTIKTTINNHKYKYVSLDFSGCTFTRIGNSAFENCTSLTNVTIPNSVTYIGDSAFYGCTSLTNVTIPDSVTSIGNYAFSGCTSLASVTIPDNVTELGYSAFSGCTSLASITIPDSVTRIKDSAFYGCTSLTEITIPDSVTSIESGTFRNCTSLTSVTIPNSVTSIGNDAFRGCTSLTSVTIPNSVTSIGNDAFYGCTCLASITIPDSVTYIGSSNAFSETAWLNNKPNGLVYAGKVALIYKGNMPANTSINLTNGTKGIVDGVFRGCTGLTSITIPDSVTSIGNYTFYGCTSLASITIPNSVTTIGEKAFQSCTSLTSVTMDGVISIWNYAFSGCTSLASVTMDGVTYLGIYAFQSCTSLTSITMDGVTTIGAGAFNCCTSLTSITIPNGVTYISEVAFSGCTKLASVTIPNSVSSIDTCAFEGCTKLISVTFQGTIPSSGFHSFAFYELGDLRNKFYAIDSTKGTPGTYTRIFNELKWTKQ